MKAAVLVKDKWLVPLLQIRAGPGSQVPGFSPRRNTFHDSLEVLF